MSWWRSFAYETMELPADHGTTMFAYTAEPRSTSAQNLDLLASWAATTAEEADGPLRQTS